jgi:hypothetical protein
LQQHFSLQQEQVLFAQHSEDLQLQLHFSCVIIYSFIFNIIIITYFKVVKEKPLCN